jgi:hypothetical protein
VISATPPRDESVAATVLARMLAKYGLSQPGEIVPFLLTPPPSSVYQMDTPMGLQEAADALRSPTGRFRFHVQLARTAPGDVHPMVSALRRAANALQLGTEMEHPLEHDSRDDGQLYRSVMTVRVVPSSGVALSSESMAFHQDGLGSAGSVQFIGMCLDSGPSTGGRQLYSNVLAQGILLAHLHWDRFVCATRRDALTIARNSGGQQVSVTGPLFYIDESGLPAAHFRSEGGEYTIRPSESVATWFSEFARAVADAAQTEVLTPGDCLVVDNLSMVHARDAFTEEGGATRRLSRKWYAIESRRAAVWTAEPLRLDPATYGSAAVRPRRSRSGS